MTSQIFSGCAIDNIFKLMVLNIVWEETHGRSINGVHTITFLFSNPYKVCQTTKLNSLPNKPCSQYL